MADRYLITWASGHYTELDAFSENNLKDNSVKLIRTSQREWEITNTLQSVQYGRPFLCGNGLYIITNCEEILAKFYYEDQALIYLDKKVSEFRESIIKLVTRKAFDSKKSQITKKDIENTQI